MPRRLAMLQIKVLMAMVAQLWAGLDALLNRLTRRQFVALVGVIAAVGAGYWIAALLQALGVI